MDNSTERYFGRIFSVNGSPAFAYIYDRTRPRATSWVGQEYAVVESVDLADAERRLAELNAAP